MRPGPGHGLCLPGRWRRDPLPDLGDDEVEELRSFLEGLPEP